MVSRKAEGSAAADLSKASALWLTRDTMRYRIEKFGLAPPA